MPKQSPGLRLKATRQAASLTQKEFGARLGGYDQTFISQIERDASKGTPDFWQAVAEVLKTPISYFLDTPTAASAEGTAGLVGSKADILASYRTPTGLRDLALDPIADALGITDREWGLLAILPLPQHVAKEGYLHLLTALRLICRDPYNKTES